jgi:hypothetical protein
MRRPITGDHLLRSRAARWFVVENDNPDGPAGLVRCTDPIARVID